MKIATPPVIKGLIKIYLTLYTTVISLRFKLHSFFLYLYRCSLDFSVLHFLHGEKVISNKIGNTIKWSKHLGTLDNLWVRGHKEKARNALPEGHIECFRKELFESNGWCKVETPFNHKGEDGWGFCDTSCDGVKVNKIIL